MSFIEQNYLWFIIAGIIIVMIIVGYIAEKTDFGHKKIEKQVKPKVEKVKQEKKEIKVEDLKNVKLGDVVYKDAIKPVDNSKSSQNNGELSKEELDALSVPIGETQPIEQITTNPKVEDNEFLSKEELEALSVPIGDTQVTPTVPVEEMPESVKESENKPIEELKIDDNKNLDTINEQPQEDNVWVDKPIEETKNASDNVESEEDIWKF